MKSDSGQHTPPYGEAQATAWLAWLARGMQQHGQTIFLIEQLQPSWLSTRTQRWVYILTSRLIWGAVIGLVGGLILWLFFGVDSAYIVWQTFGRSTGLFLWHSFWLDSSLIFGLIVFPIFGLVGGLIFGLIVGLIDVARFTRNRSRAARNVSAAPRQIIKNILLGGLVGLIFGLIFGLIVFEIFGLISGEIFGLFGGLIFGLLGGLFWALRSLGRNPRNEIQTLETIRFSLAHLPTGIVNGLFFGLFFGLIFGLIYWWSGVGAGLSGALLGVPISELIHGLVGELLGVPVFGLIGGLLVGLIFGLLSCFRPGIRELKTVPNQGILLSLRNARLMGGVGGLGLGLIMGLLGGEIGGLMGGLAYGVLGGLCIGLWYGGLDVIQHYIVRTLLWRAGAMPWDYAHFLDYAAEEFNFLQKVGGGYIFVHRYLLEYFAAMELPGQPAAIDRHDVSQPAVYTVDSV